MIDRFADTLEGLLPKRAPPWWLWPGALVTVGVVSLFLALLFQPGPGEFTSVFGRQFGDTCAFITATGYPCPQCGMTRSWVWGVRGDFLRGATYNVAGLTLFLWLQAAGVVGLARLIRRDANAYRVPFQLLFGWTMFWLVGLYTIPYALRLWGINPLP